jgi:hypothetical protein
LHVDVAAQGSGDAEPGGEEDTAEVVGSGERGSGDVQAEGRSDGEAES